MRRRAAAVGLAGLAAVAVGALAVGLAGDDGDGAETESFPLDGRPSAVAVVAGRVWVADDEGHRVHVLDAETGEPAAPAVAVERNPIALAAGGDAVWVAHAGGAVTPVGWRSAKAGTPIDAGESITGLAFGLGRVWACDLAGSAVVEIDPDARQVVRRIDVPAGAVRVAVAGDALWVTNAENTVSRVDPATGAVAAPVPVGTGPIGLAADRRRLWVANSDDDTVSRLDAATGASLGEPVTVGDAPVAVVVHRGDVWVVTQDGREVVRVDGRSGKVAARHPLAGRPRGVAWGAGAVWVAATDPGGVTRIGGDGSENAF